MLTAGIDIGHESVNVAVVDDDCVVGHATFVIAGEVGAAAALAFAQTLDRLGLVHDRIARVVATGIGREKVALASDHRTPMLSHVRGAHALFPAARTVIDMGAEGSRVMRCDARGNLTNFALNDKCAAGSGVFLETVAGMLDVPLSDMGRRSLESSRSVALTATCVVFAESEIVAEIHRGSSREDILWGVNESIASRIAATSKRVGVVPDVVVTGGVARNAGVVQALKEQLDVTIAVPRHPEIVGALGAALLAREQAGAA
jgi:predicted CoA-substrate-specific enzyme activase